MKDNNNYENYIYKNYNTISNYITEYSLISSCLSVSLQLKISTS